MHSERAELSGETAEAIRETKARGGRVVAVGTTSVRTVESAAASGEVEPFRGETRLFIRPPYRFRAVDVLLTNFHLPRSTLLVLVSAFAGRELIRRAYEEAIREGYRFYSYGDAMLVF
jgi:S-adenosylmethionine:tRNA ribosyltransferase-isomerase